MDHGDMLVQGLASFFVFRFVNAFARLALYLAAAAAAPQAGNGGDGGEGGGPAR